MCLVRVYDYSTPHLRVQFKLHTLQLAIGLLPEAWTSLKEPPKKERKKKKEEKKERKKK